MAPDIEPRREVPAEFPHELQFRLFEQMTAIGTAGAGLSIALIGSVLKADGMRTWLAIVWFGGAALLSILAQSTMTRQIYRNAARPGRYRALSLAIILLIAMGVGTLGLSVVLDGQLHHQANDLRADSKPTDR